jgi:hypothetical protein
MSDFLSINPAPDTVTIGGKKITVHGISMEGFGHLIPRFPDLMKALQDRMQKDGALTLVGIMEVAGPAIGPVLAAGLGHPGDEEAEKRAAMMSAAEQLKALTKIVEKTMPDGLGPFVAQWAALMEKFAAPPPRKIRFKVLPTPSNSSPESADIPLKQSGA